MHDTGCVTQGAYRIRGTFAQAAGCSPPGSCTLHALPQLQAGAALLLPSPGSACSSGPAALTV
jgi:hypothetical protein